MHMYFYASIKTQFFQSPCLYLRAQMTRDKKKENHLVTQEKFEY